MITEANTPTSKYGLHPPEKLKATPRGSWKYYRLLVILLIHGVIRFSLIILSNLLSIPAYLVFMAVIKPLRNHAEAAYWYIEGILFRWLQFLVSYWMWSGGYSVQESGEDVSELEEEESILLVNHQSTADVPVMMYTFQFHGRVLDKLIWIMDVLMKNTNFGPVSKVHEDFFIQQGKETRDLQPKRLRKHLLEKYLPRAREWLVIFPEGGLFWKQKKSSQEYGRKNGFPHLEHCSLPRTGAIHTILTTLNQETNIRPIKWFIDVTIAYPKGCPLNFQTIFFGQRDPMVTTVHYRKYPVTESYLDETVLRDFLFKIYTEKDKMLEAFYKTGKFPVPEKVDDAYRAEPRRIELSYGRILFTNIFFALLTLLELCIVYLAFSLVFSVLVGILGLFYIN